MVARDHRIKDDPEIGGWFDSSGPRDNTPPAAEGES
jgi:hypothetical protein